MAITAKIAAKGNMKAGGKKISEKGKMGSKASSPMGLLQSFTGKSQVTPQAHAMWDQNPVKNSLKGKGKVPLGGDKYVAHGAGTTPASKSSATIGKPLGGGSASSESGKSLKGASQGKSAANNAKGSKSLTAFITKKNSTTGQSQTIMKAKSQPKATGVPVAKAVNWHSKLGFN